MDLLDSLLSAVSPVTVIAVSAVALLLMLELRRALRLRRSRYAFVPVAAVLSKPERKLLRVLREVLKGRAEVLPKVRLADVITPDAGLARAARRAAYARIAGRRVGYLVCTPDEFRVLAVVEMEPARPQNGDRLLEELLARMGIPLVHIPVAASGSLAEVRERVDAAIFDEPASVHERREPRLGHLPMVEDIFERREPKIGGL
jgi:hypothetical protein